MPVPGPRAQAVIARDARVLSPSYTRDYPLVVQSGQGCNDHRYGWQPLS